ncbi:hypothetical protein ALP17_03715, partial [Pseudomonas savastanoi]
YSGRCSKTILMARSRTSGEYFGSFFIAPSSQRLESPRNPGRFRSVSQAAALSAEIHPCALEWRRLLGAAGYYQLKLNDTLIGFENATSHPSVGDILFYPGGYSETEIILAYGSCCFASKMGQLAGNHFLTITQGKENLRKLGVKTLWEGAQDVVFELA